MYYFVDKGVEMGGRSYQQTQNFVLINKQTTKLIDFLQQTCLFTMLLRVSNYCK